MTSKYDPPQLAVDLVEFVDDDNDGYVIEQARIMAHEEDKHRSFAKQYLEYQKDTGGNFGLKSEFAELARLGVSAEYILRFGELSAEICGEIYECENYAYAYNDDTLSELAHALKLGVVCAEALRIARNYDAKHEYAHEPEDLNMCLRLRFLKAKEKAIRSLLDERSHRWRWPTFGFSGL